VVIFNDDVFGVVIDPMEHDAGHYPERTEMMYWRNCRLRIVVADLLESVGRHYRTSLGKRRQLQVEDNGDEGEAIA
jgi:hypothetical protein